MQSIPRQPVYLTSACANSPYSILHELAHVASLVHEHQRCDRDTYITVYTSNLNTRGSSEIGTKLCGSSYTYYNSATYDYASITHYPSYVSEFSINSSQPILLRKPNNTQINFATGLSTGDKTTLNTIY